MISIYKITNKFITPNKMYIGQTSNSLDKRLYEHVRIGRSGVNRELSKDLVIYGTINFIIELLEIVDDDVANIVEDSYIRKLNTHYKNGYGYNMKYEDIKKDKLVMKDNDSDIVRYNLNNGRPWNTNLKMGKYISEKIKKTIAKKISDGWINPGVGHLHTNESKLKISNIKKKYYTTNRPHNTINWIVSYEDGNIINTNRLLDYLGGKKEYNKITKWSRDNKSGFHPQSKMRVDHDRTDC